jgi:hypothetical protein
MKSYSHGEVIGALDILKKRKEKNDLVVALTDLHLAKISYKDFIDIL